MFFDKFNEYPVKIRKDQLMDVKTSTSVKPISEWVITGQSYIDDQALEGIRRKAGFHKSLPEKLSLHDQLVKELLEIGKWLGFVVKKEVATPDGVYRIDVVWSDAEGHAPLKAFEVEISGNVNTALARLTHAYDNWRCEQLWLIGSDEAREERAEKLVRPRLEGLFAR